MPELLFKLRHVPDDEAEEVRALLAEHDIRFYETSEGNWKIAVPAIWLPDDSQAGQARELLADYQRKRVEGARIAHQEQLAAGSAPTLWSLIRRSPIRVLLYLAAAGVTIYLSVMPFLNLGS